MRRETSVMSARFFERNKARRCRAKPFNLVGRRDDALEYDFLTQWIRRREIEVPCKLNDRHGVRVAEHFGNFARFKPREDTRKNNEVTDDRQQSQGCAETAHPFEKSLT